MINMFLSFPVPEIIGSGSELVSTYSRLSVGEKVAVLTLLLAIIGLASKSYKQYREHQSKLRELFKLTWKNSTSIGKDDILGNRPFKEYYYTRPEDEKVRVCLKDGKNVLIVGSPLSGKTRMVYEALRISKKYDLIIPRSTNIDIVSFILPRQLKFWKPRLLFIDDFHRFVEQQNFEYLFEVCRKNKISLIATCRSEIEYKKTKKRMLDKHIDLETELFSKVIEINEISEEKGKEIAETVDKPWTQIKFNKTIGSIFMPLSEMHRRFEECTFEEKSILKAIKKLYICGVYEEGQIFQLDQIKKVSENEGVNKTKSELEELIGILCEQEFTKIKENNLDRIGVEEVYLEDIVELNHSELHVFEELLSTFAESPEALSKMGKKAYEIGSVNLQEATYMNIAIRMYMSALEITNVDQFEYAIIQDNLGNAYDKLAEVKDTAQNCKKAIEAFQNALNTINKEKFPIQYAMVQDDLGSAYRKLAEVEDTAQNCIKAIEAFQNALNTINKEKFPIQYAMVQDDLGSAYFTLAKVEGKAQNCINAIEAYQNALKIRTKEKFPIQYAVTQNNLGTAYRTLAEVEDKAQNCKKAIEVFQDALEIRTKEKFPIQYVATQNNLGKAYRTLAEVEDKAQNCKKALEVFQDALNIATELPIQYAMIENNMGDTYKTLAEVEYMAQNCKKALEVYQNARKIFNEKGYPMYSKIVKSNIEDLANFCKIKNIEID